MSTNLPRETLLRYSRQIRLPQVGVEGQRQLLGARVLLIGMGALGGPAAMYLTAAGVGTLGLADFDKVEVHNLQRQIIHSNAAVGEPKLTSASRTLQAINPAVQLELHPQGITLENAVKLISKYDLVIDGSDNFPTRYLVNDAAFLARKPLVYGSIFQFEGQLSVFDPNCGTPCYRCLFPQMPEPGTVPNCEQAGVFGALPGVIGSFQAMEAIKLITGVGKPLSGRLLVVDALVHRNRYITLKKDPECPLCSATPQIKSIAAVNYEWSCPTSNTTADAAATDTAATDATDSAARTAPLDTATAAACPAPSLSATNPATNKPAANEPVAADSATKSAVNNTTATMSSSSSDASSHAAFSNATGTPASGKPLPVEISVGEADILRRSATAEAPVMLIDVREPFEYEIGHIEGAHLIPLGTIADAVATLPQDRPLILYCHLGMRSLRAAQFLRQQGYPLAASVSGGIDAWAERIDPTIPRY